MNKSEMTRGLGVKFDRIRRITGYLTGSVCTWNSCKQAELNDRVKHICGKDMTNNVVILTKKQDSMREKVS